MDVIFAVSVTFLVLATFIFFGGPMRYAATLIAMMPVASMIAKHIAGLLCENPAWMNVLSIIITCVGTLILGIICNALVDFCGWIYRQIPTKERR